MKIKWYWIIYWITLTICFVKWFSPGMILIFCVITLVMLLIEQRNDKGMTIYTVCADNDDENEKEKDEKTDTVN